MEKVIVSYSYKNGLELTRVTDKDNINLAILELFGYSSYRSNPKVSQSGIVYYLDLRRFIFYGDNDKVLNLCSYIDRLREQDIQIDRIAVCIQEN